MMSHDTILLSPKNIYRLLNNNQLKLSARAELPRSKPGEMTLVRFYRQILLPVAPQQVIETMLNPAVKRSRSLSDIMNRTGYAGAQSTLHGLFLRDFDDAQLLKLTSSYIAFLEERDCDPIILSDQLTLFEEAFFADDPAISKQVRAHLMALRGEAEQGTEVSEEHLLFLQALRLSWLTIYAFLGKDIEISDIFRVRSNQACLPDQLWLRFSHISFGRMVPRVLTTRECQLCLQALPEREYMDPFRQAEYIADRFEALAKMLISAPGGMGKTELARQVLHKIEERSLFARVAYVQYHGGLIASLRRSFPACREIPADQVLEEVRTLLEMQGLGRTLLLIDDACPDDDPAFSALATFGCDILITSRQIHLTGFESFQVRPLDQAAVRTLLERICQRPFSDPPQAFQHLTDRVGGHPLALTLLARICSIHGYTIQELNQEIERQGLQGLTMIRNGEETSILHVLEAVFRTSVLDDGTRRLLALFSTFRGGQWQVKQIAKLFEDIFPDPHVLANRLYECVRLGFLTGGNGYGMPRVLSDVLDRQAAPLAQYPRLHKTLEDTFLSSPSQESPVWTEAALRMLMFFSAQEPAGVLPLLPGALQAAADFMDTEAMHALLQSWIRLQPEDGCMAEERLIRACCAAQLHFESKDLPAMRVQLQKVLDAKEGLTARSLRSVLSLNRLMYDPDTMMRYRSLLEQFPLDGVPGALLFMREVFLFQLLMDCADAEGALSHMQSAMEQYALLRDPDPKIIAMYQFLMGSAAYAQGQLQEACDHMNRAIACYQELPERLQKKNIAPINSYLAAIYKDMGQMEKALACAQANLPVPASEFTAVTMEDIADLSVMVMCLSAMGRYEEALDHNTRAIRTYRKLTAAGDSMELASMWRTRGSIYLGMKRPDRALVYFRRARDTLVSLAGEEHFRVAETDLYIAKALMKRGRRREALHQAAQAEEKLNSMLPPDHPLLQSAQDLIKQLKADL